VGGFPRVQSRILQNYISISSTEFTKIVYLQAAMKGQRQDCADLTPLQRREK
jgi:hypothetical protein